MADKDITNQQLLDALTNRFDSLDGRFDGLEDKFGGLEGRFDKLEKMVAGIGDAVSGIANDMATSEELTEFKEEVHEDFDNLELRLGRRIDAAFSMKTAKTAH